MIDMGAGFYVPSGLIESRGTGLDLIHYVQSIWMGVPAKASNAGQIALADWIMANSGKADSLRPSSVIERLLTGEVVPSETLAAVIAARTDGAVTPDLWDRASDAEKRPKRAARPDGDDTAAPPPAAVPSPHCTPDVTMSLCGRLGERPGGPLFTTISTTDGVIMLVGQGICLGLDEFGAAAAHDALGRALSLRGAR